MTILAENLRAREARAELGEQWAERPAPTAGAAGRRFRFSEMVVAAIGCGGGRGRR